MGGNMAVTIRDIARIAQVSHMTVSRALNNSPLVKEDTKEKVMQIAQQMGFEFNASARALCTKSTGCIGIVYSLRFIDPRNSQYTITFLHEIQGTLEQMGFDSILVSLFNVNTGQSNAKRLAMQQKVDGFIFISSLLDDETVALLEQKQIPFVYVDPTETIPTTQKVSVYATNNVMGGMLATDCLIEKGYCKNPICMSLSQQDSQINISDRIVGFEKSMKNHGLSVTPASIVRVGPGAIFDLGYRYIQLHIKQLLQNKVDGIFAVADLLALGILAALKERAIDVPGDIRIVGYDNTTIGTYFSPRLTTIHQPREQLSLLSCKKLVSLIKTYRLDNTVYESIPPKLITRETC
jgi:LacI family transcriptional regulator